MSEMVGNDLKNNYSKSDFISSSEISNILTVSLEEG